VIAILLVSIFALSPIGPVLGDTPPSIPNANVFTESDLPKVDGASGAFTQRIQLDTPPGRNGLQPDLALQYNSQNTADSIVGYGWSLSIPYIQRLNKTGSQNLYSATAPYFTSSIDGELVASTTIISASSSPPSVETNTHGSTGISQCTAAIQRLNFSCIEYLL
jgi:hypothetical protein